MPDQQTRSLKILAAVQAVVSGAIAVVIFAFFGLGRQLLTDTNASMTTAMLGTAGVVYYLTIHQLLAKKRLGLSTLILSCVTAINVIMVIGATGGLDSPFYSLWLLAIVTAGLFGRAQAIGIMTVTIVYYGYELINGGLTSPYWRDHLIQLGVTLVAGGLAEWVHSRNRKAAGEGSQRIKTLAGQLNTAEVKADAVMTYIGEGVMVIDGERKIQLFNAAAQELSSWDESSAKNIDLSLVLQLKTQNDQPLTEETDPFTIAWKSGKTIVRDNLTMTSRTGRKMQLSMTVSPIFDPAHQPTGAVCLFRDVSKEKAVEREKDEFVSTASHEMRTPVAAIEGYLSLAMNPNVATIDERAKKYLDKAHEAIAHLGELFRDLLSVTKAEEGNLNLKIEPVNLAKLLETATGDMRQLAAQKKLTIVFQVGGQGGKTISPLYYVAANPERLREVIMNLIDNAIKFTMEGGIKVTLDGNDKEVTVGVQDTGLGIDPADISHLFQKFYRVDSSATRTIGGTGLGLYLCRRAIELFNGRIWVESRQGQGSTFRFSLPRLSQDEVARMEAELSEKDEPKPAEQAPAPATAAETTPAPAPAPEPAPEPAPAPEPPAPAAAPAPAPVPALEAKPVDGLSVKVPAAAGAPSDPAAG